MNDRHSGFELAVDRVATGGAALGRGPDGRVVFVSGAIPGERVLVEVTDIHKSRIEARVVEVLAPVEHRTVPPCPHVADGCGGCDWQHVTPQAQSQLRHDIVADCLRRLGGLPDVDVRLGPKLEASNYRTTVRAAVEQGRASYRLRSSHKTVAIDSCAVAHPLVEEILVDGRFGAATEVVVRVGANTGERMVIVDPDTDGVDVPDDVTVIGRDELRAGRTPHYHEELAGRRLQISADSFFQCRPDGALALAELAGDAIADVEGALLDAYCGVGLFGALAGTGRSIIGVESDASAAADAVFNLGHHARVTEVAMERWQVEPVAVVIADPARIGLRAAACDRLVSTEAKALVLISCDPAALARDAKLLHERGYRLDHVTVVDMFAHTSHVETVSRFTLAG